MWWIFLIICWKKWLVLLITIQSMKCLSSKSLTWFLSLNRYLYRTINLISYVFSVLVKIELIYIFSVSSSKALPSNPPTTADSNTFDLPKSTKKHYHWFKCDAWLGLGNHSSMGRRNWKKKIPVMNRNSC